jgi:mRNA interferase RelE/StbE
MAYQLQISKKSLKFLSSLDTGLGGRIGSAIQKLSENPFPQGSIKLVGSESEYRIPVGDYRIIYQVQEFILVVFVIRIGHRRDIYR